MCMQYTTIPCVVYTLTLSYYPFLSLRHSFFNEICNAFSNLYWFYLSYWALDAQNYFIYFIYNMTQFFTQIDNKRDHNSSLCISPLLLLFVTTRMKRD